MAVTPVYVFMYIYAATQDACRNVAMCLDVLLLCLDVLRQRVGAAVGSWDVRQGSWDVRQDNPRGLSDLKKMVLRVLVAWAGGVESVRKWGGQGGRGGGGEVIDNRRTMSREW